MTTNANYDPEQVQFMQEDMCIVVNEKDEITGKDTKEACHLMDNINKGLLHRAFSIFLFNNENKLLLQQRSDKKITFPSCWTNTVCSHPLYNAHKDEANGVSGVKLAAQRKLGHELNIPASEVPITNMKFLTRIHYLAATDQKWGEHEVDYIIFIKSDKVTVNPNPGEVKDFKFVTMDEVRNIVSEAAQGKLKISPWFGLIFKQFLSSWWEKLIRGQELPSDDKIHKVS